jgi:hypothetical protein
LDYIVLQPDQLKDGAYYTGRCRVANVARWDAETRLFYMWRTKFGTTFLVTERHINEEPRWDAFAPTEETQEIPREIPIDRTLGCTHGA